MTDMANSYNTVTAQDNRKAQRKFSLVETVVSAMWLLWTEFRGDEGQLIL